MELRTDGGGTQDGPRLWHHKGSVKWWAAGIQGGTSHGYAIWEDGGNTQWGTERFRIDPGGRVNMPIGWDTSGRNYSRDWIEFPNHTGLYSPLNGAHFYPNNASYGPWRIAGTRNGWAGLEFDSTGAGQISLMMNSGHTGVHNNTYSWQWYWTGGTFYVSKSTYGGGTIATVLDSSNYNSYAPTLTGGNASGTWGISITGNCASASQLNGIAASNYFRVDGTYANTDMNAPVEGYWHVASTASNLPNLNTDNDPNKPPSTIYAFGHRWDYDHAGDGNWVAQFYSPTTSDAGLWFRQRRGGTWQTWRKFVDTQTMGIALFGMEGASFARDYMGGIILTVNRISAGVYEVYMASGGFGLINVATSTIFHTTYTYSNGRVLTYNAAGTPTDSRYISIISVDTF
jgi:hypothetical protein